MLMEEQHQPTPIHTPSPAAQTQEQKAGAMKAYSLGTIVFGVLIALTIVEYFIGGGYILGGSIIILAIIALAKAGLIVQYFMHIYRLWTDEEGH